MDDNSDGGKKYYYGYLRPSADSPEQWMARTFGTDLAGRIAQELRKNGMSLSLIDDYGGRQKIPMVTARDKASAGLASAIQKFMTEAHVAKNIIPLFGTPEDKRPHRRDPGRSMASPGPRDPGLEEEVDTFTDEIYAGRDRMYRGRSL